MLPFDFPPATAVTSAANQALIDAVAMRDQMESMVFFKGFCRDHERTLESPSCSYIVPM